MVFVFLLPALPAYDNIGRTDALELELVYRLTWKVFKAFKAPP